MRSPPPPNPTQSPWEGGAVVMRSPPPPTPTQSPERDKFGAGAVGVPARTVLDGVRGRARRVGGLDVKSRVGVPGWEGGAAVMRFSPPPPPTQSPVPARTVLDGVRGGTRGVDGLDVWAFVEPPTAGDCARLNGEARGEFGLEFVV